MEDANAPSGGAAPQRLQHPTNTPISESGDLDVLLQREGTVWSSIRQEAERQENPGEPPVAVVTVHQEQRRDLSDPPSCCCDLKGHLKTASLLYTGVTCPPLVRAGRRPAGAEGCSSAFQPGATEQRNQTEAPGEAVAPSGVLVATMLTTWA